MNSRGIVLCLALSFPSVLAADEPVDFEKIQGVWKAVSIETEGKADPGASLGNARFVFERKLLTIYQDKKRIGSFRFALADKKSPAQIDLAAENPAAETAKLGIYRLKGDGLEICLGESRPKEFRGAGGADLLRFERPKTEKLVAVPVWCLDVSPDGQRLAVAGGRRNASGQVAVLSSEDWSPVALHTEQRAATCVAFSPDGHQLAIGNQVGEVAVLNLKSKQIEQRWHTGSWAVFGITWTPDGRELIAACANGFLKRFCADCGTLKMTFDTWKADGTPNTKLGGHADRNLWDAAVSRDGNTMLSGGWNGTTRIWNLTTGEMIQAFSGDEQSTQGVKLTPDERHIVSTGLGTEATIIRRTGTFSVRAKLDAFGRDVAAGPDGKLIAVSTLEDVRIFRLDLSEPAPDEIARYEKLAAQLADENTSQAAADKLKAVGLPADSVLEKARQTAKGDHLKRIEQLLAEIQSPQPVATLPGHQGEVRQVVISPKGNFFATATMTGEVRIWDPKTFDQKSWILKSEP